MEIDSSAGHFLLPLENSFVCNHSEQCLILINFIFHAHKVKIRMAFIIRDGDIDPVWKCFIPADIVAGRKGGIFRSPYQLFKGISFHLKKIVGIRGLCPVGVRPETDPGKQKDG